MLGKEGFGGCQLSRLPYRATYWAFQGNSKIYHMSSSTTVQVRKSLACEVGHVMRTISDGGQDKPSLPGVLPEADIISFIKVE